MKRINLKVPGRMYPVDILYARKMKMAALKGQIVPKSVETVLQIHKSEPPGDILVFLTGQQEIESACKLIKSDVEETLRADDLAFGDDVWDLSVHPIYSALDTPEQKAVFSPAKKGFRKVVVATNIAQTSITIPVKFINMCS
jgi:HrpA-like RNA helicase